MGSLLRAQVVWGWCQAGTAEEMKVEEAGLCARQGAGGSHSRGPPGGLARVLSGRAGVHPSAWSSLLPPVPGRARSSGVRLPRRTLSPSAPKAAASSAQALPAPPRCNQGAGKGRGEGPPSQYLRLSGKSICPQPRTKGRRAGSLRVKEAASVSLTVKWGQTHFI